MAEEKTLRDEFAIAALTGLLAHYGTAMIRKPPTEWAFEIADAMMEGREK